jgi:hypothetical protein
MSEGRREFSCRHGPKTIAAAKFSEAESRSRIRKLETASGLPHYMTRSDIYVARLNSD